MTQNSSSQYSGILVVAGPQWKRCNVDQLTSFVSRLQWSTSVYDALAWAIQRNGRAGPLLACIAVDHLGPEEMQIFRCLSQMERVTSVAFSDSKQPVKLDQARRLGAGFVLESDRLVEWLRQHESPADSASRAQLYPDDKAICEQSDVESVKIAETVVKDDLERLVRKQIGVFKRPPPPESVRRYSPSQQKQPLQPIPPSSTAPVQPEPTAKRIPPSRQTIERPTLSQDEREALLG